MTKYALIENNAITRTGSLVLEFPNTSFPRPLPDEHEGWVKIVTPSVPNGKVLTQDVSLIDGVPTYDVRDLTSAEKLEHLERYGSDFENSEFTFGNFTEDGTEEHRRNVKETIDFLRELGDSAPTTIPWNSPNHGVQSVTLSDLLGWLMGVGQRRFKRFVLQTSLRPTLDEYETLTQIEDAFDEAYSS